MKYFIVKMCDWFGWLCFVDRSLLKKYYAIKEQKLDS